MRSRVQFLTALAFTAAGVLGYETVEDAAVIARHLVDSSPDYVGTMATIYPTSHDLAGSAFPLQEYYAPCHANGSLALLFLPISRHSQNILHSPSHAASITVASEHPRASRARVSLIGNVTILSDSDASVPDIKTCYLAKHRDARWWLPGDEDGAHVSHWARFDPHTIYFVGGFGDTHYIGYIPLDLYQHSGQVQHVEDCLQPVIGATEDMPMPSSVAGRILLNQGGGMMTAAWVFYAMDPLDSLQ